MLRLHLFLCRGLNDAITRNSPTSVIEEEEKKIRPWDQVFTAEDIENTKQVRETKWG